MKEIIFFTTDITVKAGIERITINLANYFISQGLSVRIVSNFKTNQSPAYNHNSKIRFDFLTDRLFSGSPGSFKRLIMFIQNINRVKKYFAFVKNAIIISQAFPNTFVLNLCKKTIKNNVVFVVEHVCYSYYNKIIRAIRLIIYKKFAGTILLTTNDYNYFTNHNIRSFLIPNGIELPIKDTNSMRNRNNTIISIGRLVYQKNFSELIYVFSELHKKYPDWNLVIYGEGEERTQLEKLIKELDIEAYVALPGVIDDVNEVLLKSSIFVVTSLLEGFSIVLIEAMSNTLACVSYDCPYGPKTIITDKKDGFLIENQNRNALYECICYLIDNPDIRESIGINAQESVKRFDINVVGKQWLSLFSTDVQ